jgi:hypothetical protein
MLVQDQLFLIDEYEKKSVFSSFLPGINGLTGIPVWSFYVNRGQCITSFGTMDKEHSIMEFYPAHQAYQRTGSMGFRTFIKVDGKCVEAFTKADTRKQMFIGKNELRIEETDEENQICVKVCYTTLPEEPLGALMRSVKIINLAGKERSFEVLDGMPELIPYGVSLSSMKEMSQTAKAWMEVLDHEKRMPRFKVRASMQDTAQVSQVEEFHFALAVCREELLSAVVGKETIFGYDTALQSPMRFEDKSAEQLSAEKQITQNEVPCCFFAKDEVLSAGGSVELQELYGMSKSTEHVRRTAEKLQTGGYYEEKQKRAKELTEELTDAIATKSGHPVFDEYCRQSYLDNLLRGGSPIQLGRHIFYVYSRKHGDIERDYNFFMMYPESYSQGNGNFRDVNQNRRTDVQFAPFVEDQNIKAFYSYIQTNGYNPLGIEKSVYRLLDERYKDIITGTFTPGQLYEALRAKVSTGADRERLFEEIMDNAEAQNETSFIEGYWTDHWTYNLDMVESYLSVYPERESELLFEDNDYTYRQSAAAILPRRERYEKTENGIRQYHFLKKLEENGKYVTDKEGNVVQGSLAEKMFLLCVLKTAALDPYGMGIEMEGGKPGWYDALNGLPGLLGSSMAETYELERLFDYLINAVKKHQKSITVPGELAVLVSGMVKAIDEEKENRKTQGADMGRWNAVNDLKEKYWKETETGFWAGRITLSPDTVLAYLEALRSMVGSGIEKAAALGDDPAPTYFFYEVTSWEEEDGIMPTGFKLHRVPSFLEGPVRALKLSWPKEAKKKLYDTVKESNLYDRKLQMYKVNESLSEASFELGRAKAFTPGWLENESIWLHMEYKYLLELLKNEMYEEYEQDFVHAAVPFLKEEVYGRSLLENSSFIVSSDNPNPELHGKGFVARLSGSTAEFLQMWQIMMFGKNPFFWEDGKLQLSFCPMLPKLLIGKTKLVSARFLGTTEVTYHLPDRETIDPKNSHAVSYFIFWKDGTEEICKKPEGHSALRIRQGEAEKIEVQIERG